MISAAIPAARTPRPTHSLCHYYLFFHFVASLHLVPNQSSLSIPDPLYSSSKPPNPSPFVRQRPTPFVLPPALAPFQLPRHAASALRNV